MFWAFSPNSRRSFCRGRINARSIDKMDTNYSKLLCPKNVHRLKSICLFCGVQSRLDAFEVWEESGNLKSVNERIVIGGI